jgi:hypothetical protein
MLNPTLQLVSVVLGLVFACLAIVCVRKCSELLTQARATVASIRSSLGKIEAHDAAIEALADSVHQLRGKFYAERRKSQPGTSNSDSQEEPTGAATVDGLSLKDHLRRKAGLLAGQPAPHR